MGQCEDHANDDADTRNDDIGNAQERVLASENRSGAEENGLRSTIFRGWKVIIDFHLVNSGPQNIIIVAKGELAKSGQASRPHPDVELFVG